MRSIQPPDLIAVDELPPGWGLIEVRGEKFKIVKRAQPQERRELTEIALLISALRRIGGAIPEGSGVSVSAYTYQTTNRATLGVAPAEHSQAEKEA